ncbi:MAG: hypothetical protein ACOCY3_04645 [Desulfosalsimonas sp.]
MKAALDVYYSGGTAAAECIAFERWSDCRPAGVIRAEASGVRGYRPGRFYERELPCLMAVLDKSGIEFDTIIIDGFVHLKTGRGLGAHLRDRLPYSCTVIGVAKSRLAVAAFFVEVRRGRSKRPLFVSAAGMETEKAAEIIKGMHGPYRLPTMLRLADQAAKNPEAVCSTP